MLHNTQNQSACLLQDSSNSVAHRHCAGAHVPEKEKNTFDVIQFDVAKYDTISDTNNVNVNQFDSDKSNKNTCDKLDKNNLPSFSCWLLSGYSDDGKLIHICNDNIDDILQYLGFNHHNITTIKLLITQQVNQDSNFIDFKLSTWKNDICYRHYFSSEQ